MSGGRLFLIPALAAVSGLGAMAAVVIPHPSGGLSVTRFIVGCAVLAVVQIGGTWAGFRIASRRPA